MYRQISANDDDDDDDDDADNDESSILLFSICNGAFVVDQTLYGPTYYGYIYFNENTFH